MLAQDAKITLKPEVFGRVLNAAQNKTNGELIGKYVEMI